MLDPADTPPAVRILGTDAAEGLDRVAADWRVNNFDLVRLLAALQVAVVHAMGQLTPNPGILVHRVASVLSLFPGVPVFFVISGLLISKSYEQSPSLGNYWRNRCLRIFPGLWVCLVASAGVILAIGVDAIGTVSPRGWLIWWCAQMSIFQNYEAPFLDPLGRLNSSLWTIPVELEFYLVLPALYFILRLRERRGNVLLFTLLLTSLLAHWVVTRHPARLAPLAHYQWLILEQLPYLWMFLVGVLMQRNWTRVRGYLAGRVHWWLLSHLLVCLVAVRLNIPVSRGTVGINPLSLLVLAGLVVSFATSLRGLSEQLLRSHDLSYGLYIYHAPVIVLLLHAGARNGWLSVAAAILISVALAMLSWRFIERPYLMRKRTALRTVSTGSPNP